MQDQSSGVLLALDDGYGSFTDQDAAGLQTLIQQQGFQVHSMDYAKDDMPSGYFVARYLTDADQAIQSTNPYIGVLLHAIDCLSLSAELASHLSTGHVVLARQYVTSIVAREATRFASAPERAAFYLWADQILFDTFGLTRPEKIFLIGGESTEVSVKARLFDEMAGVFSRDIKLIDCYRNGHRLRDDVVQSLLADAVLGMLPEPAPDASSPHNKELRVWMPVLNDTLAETYQATLSEILQLRGDIDASLSEKGVSREAREKVFRLLSPLALDPLEPADPDFSDVLPGYSQDHRDCVLIAVQPKNEFDLVPELLFASSDLSTAEIVSYIDKMKFEQKDALLQTLLAKTVQHGAVASLPVSYTFELLTSHETYHIIKQALPEADIAVQPLTPRYGYDLPDSIEDAEVTDAYLECFDKSMTLFSQLEAAGQHAVAGNACLRGHKRRWRITVNYKQMTFLDELLPGKELVTTLWDKIQNRQPVLYELRDQL